MTVLPMPVKDHKQMEVFSLQQVLLTNEPVLVALEGVLPVASRPESHCVAGLRADASAHQPPNIRISSLPLLDDGSDVQLDAFELMPQQSVAPGLQLLLDDAVELAILHLP